MRHAILYSLSSILAFSSATLATSRHIRIPLHDGRLNVTDLTNRLQHDLNLPLTFAPPASLHDIDLRSIKGSLLVTALNESLPTSAHVTLTDDALDLTIDPAHLPRSETALKKSLRTFVATMTPDATAAQAHTYGLSLPANLEDVYSTSRHAGSELRTQRDRSSGPDSSPSTSRTPRLVVLIHGLDCNPSAWDPIATMLENDGYLTARFSYPSDQPIADSAASLTESLQALKQSFPDLPVSIVAHSMGSLVARAYVEGPDYAGGIDHLILLAPPNHGTPLARYRLLLELQEHFHLARSNPDWRPSWIITDGLGEAGADLTPNSQFLRALNAYPRRDGVKYTIINANQSPAYPLAARALDQTSRALIPDCARDLPGLNKLYTHAQRTADRLAHRTGNHDGPVSLKSTRLEGVSDYVTYPTSHCTLQMGTPTTPPPAYQTIADRLAR